MGRMSCQNPEQDFGGISNAWSAISEQLVDLRLL